MVHSHGRLAPGKHTDVHVETSGIARNVRHVTKRLLFFELWCSPSDRVECIAKDRDGFLSAADIAVLGDALGTAPTEWRIDYLAAYPEVGSPETVLH
eukprot:5121306-Prymnesium_polylepis.1